MATEIETLFSVAQNRFESFSYQVTVRGIIQGLYQLGKRASVITNSSVYTIVTVLTSWID